MPGEPLMIRCEGSGCPAPQIDKGVVLVICRMCGRQVFGVSGRIVGHEREDILAMIEREADDAG